MATLRMSLPYTTGQQQKFRDWTGTNASASERGILIIAAGRCQSLASRQLETFISTVWTKVHIKRITRQIDRHCIVDGNENG